MEVGTVSDFLDAWLHHWGWAWMIIGLLGACYITITFSDN